MTLCFRCTYWPAGSNQEMLDGFCMAAVQGSFHEEHYGYSSENTEGKFWS